MRRLRRGGRNSQADWYYRQVIKNILATGGCVHCGATLEVVAARPARRYTPRWEVALRCPHCEQPDEDSVTFCARCLAPINDEAAADWTACPCCGFSSPRPDHAQEWTEYALGKLRPAQVEAAYYYEAPN